MRPVRAAASRAQPPARGKGSCRLWNGDAPRGFQRPMDQRTRDEGLSGANRQRVIVRRPLWARITLYLAVVLLALLALLLIGVWIERRPIATHFIQRELESRGVQG